MNNHIKKVAYILLVLVCFFQGNSQSCIPLLGTTLFEVPNEEGIYSTTISYSGTCPTKDITFLGVPDWITGLTDTSTSISFTCLANDSSSSRTASIAVNVDGAYRGFLVKQGVPIIIDPDPDPTTCEGITNVYLVDGGSEVNFDWDYEVRDIQLGVNPAICSNSSFEIEMVDLNNTSWLTLKKSGTTLQITCEALKEYKSRSASFWFKAEGATKGFMVIKQSTGTSFPWYPDNDNDGFGSPFYDPIISQNEPPPTTTVFSWAANNDDRCVDVASIVNNGCPAEEPSDNKNWIQLKSYDIKGQQKTNQVSYYDQLGKIEQYQVKDYRKIDALWVSETRYDQQGRTAMQTLPSQIAQPNLAYKLDFIKKSDGNDLTNSDYENTNPDDPALVGAQQNTLGWYYSENNDSEPYQDITDRPYSRTIYSELNPGTVLKTIGGNKINGEWKNGYTFSMPAGEELAQPGAFGDSKYNADNYKIIKTVSRNVHGVESAVFTDADGKTLAAARSGNEDKNIENTRKASVKIGAQGYVDIHVPVGRTGVTLAGNSGIVLKKYNLITEKEETALASTLPNGFYRFAVEDLSSYISGSITITYPENYYDYSLNEYDKAGRLVSTKQPLQKLESTFEYNALGQLTQTHNPDEGDAWFLYRKDGQIRFSINSKQWESGQFSYTEYDKKGRPIESGVYLDSASSYLNLFSDTVSNITDPFTNALKNRVDSTNQFSDSNRIEVNKTQYDISTNTNLLPDDYEFPTFLSGSVAKTENDNTTTWYSYDIYGRVKWVVQNIKGLSGYKTIDYEYDDPVSSQVAKVWYQKGDNSDQFIHRYTYDAVDYSLIKVETSTDNNNYTEHAQYEYYETGALKRLNLADGLQGIDYVYNLNGALKGINHPNLEGSDPGNDNKDLFGMSINYYNGDYARTNTPTNVPSLADGIDQYNGNIKSVIWSTRGHSDKDRYYYKYNKNNWLEGASFNDPLEGVADLQSEESRNTVVSASETVKATTRVRLSSGFRVTANNALKFKAQIVGNSEIDHSGDYNVYDITYDANGNIQTLNRNKNTENGSNAMDKLSYTYRADKANQLTSVADAIQEDTDASDIKTQSRLNYVYNNIGQLVVNHADELFYFYNAIGLVSEIRKAGIPLVKFFYNDKNHRVRKESYNPDNGNLTYTEHYVRDAAGTAMAIYRDGNVVENTIYGASRLGVCKADGTNLYQLTDHLGNVRAVVGKDSEGNELAITSATDYYPFGMLMPDRNEVGDYRYSYQGQEKDPETGKEAFELRLWDARIGRWLTTDPYRQYSSPYLGMGNNPINGIDPDGGFTWLGAKWFKFWNGGDISKVEGENGSWYKVTGFGAEGSSIAVGGGAVRQSNRGYRVPVGGGGLSLFNVRDRSYEDLPGVYIEANSAITQGSIGADVRFLGARAGLKGEIAKSPIYQLGFNVDTSQPEDKAFINTSTFSEKLGDSFGGGASYGIGADFKFDRKTGQIKEITTSALVTEFITEFHTEGIHKGKVSRTKAGFNIGASGSFFVGAEAGIKFGVIIPNSSK